jgi:hypothetical protein
VYAFGVKVEGSSMRSKGPFVLGLLSDNLSVVDEADGHPFRVAGPMGYPKVGDLVLDH